ncbi:collagen-like protein [Megavirus courdo7]|nr:collagen-like protein [Megavirus courdo7]
MGVFTYSGAGGGAGGSLTNLAKGGDVGEFTGGASLDTDGGGGGGASAFANGGNGEDIVNNAGSGTFGSGGGGAGENVGNSPIAGNGGDGFVRIDYYSA